MRGVRSLLVLVVVAVGLGAYIYFVESKKPAGGEASEVRPKVFSVAADKITDLKVKAAGGEQTTLRKSDGTWQIVEPVQARADDTEASGIATNIATVENTRTVEENPRDLKEFGLAVPRIDIAFKTSADKDFRHLLIGDKTVVGSDMYAQVGGQKKVFLISSYLEPTFNRTTFDLREKSVLKFDREKLDRLELTSPDRTIQLALAGGEWSLVKPIAAPADFGTVESIVGRLQTAQMKLIVAQEGANPKEYGLDKPQLTVTLGSGSASATLVFGRKHDDTTVYAKDASRPMVFTVESSLLDDLAKPADQYRRKDVFAFRSYNATTVEIVRGADTVAYERVKAQGKEASDKWRRTKPAAKDMDAAKLETALTKLANLRAQSWVDAKTKTGLDAPVMVASVTYEDGKKSEKVSFGKVGADVYASVAGQQGAAKIDPTEFDDAIKALDALKQ